MSRLESIVATRLDAPGFGLSHVSFPKLIPWPGTCPEKRVVAC
jgi:hypothetical protein